jgi:addiction module HigA family antidote
MTGGVSFSFGEKDTRTRLQSFTITEGSMVNNDQKIAPIHPGVVLLDEFLNPMNLSQNRLALDIRVPARRINEIVLGKRRISPDTALRLARFFDMSPEYWLGLQMDYDLDVAEDRSADVIRREVHVYSSR